jgi:DNA-binding NtrC family response regulator
LHVHVAMNILLIVRLGENLRESLERILTLGSGRRLAAVSCRNEALRMLLRETVTVILTTPRLPDGSWHDFISQTAAMLAPPNLIVVPLDPGGPMREEALSLGAYGWLADLSDYGEVRMLVAEADRNWGSRCNRFHASSAGKPNVLAVDDNLMILDLIARILQRDGLVVRTAQNVWQATELVRHHDNISVVILDWRMPEMPGEQVLDHRDRDPAWYQGRCGEWRTSSGSEARLLPSQD